MAANEIVDENTEKLEQAEINIPYYSCEQWANMFFHAMENAGFSSNEIL